MKSLPAISRRQALGLGAGLFGVLALAPSSLASATISGSTQPCDGGFAGYWHEPANPYNEDNLGGPGVGDSTNLITNASFEDGAPGNTAPGWTFVPPPPP